MRDTRCEFLRCFGETGTTETNTHKQIIERWMLPHLTRAEQKRGQISRTRQNGRLILIIGRETFLSS
jgi:hypothetical protein